MEDSWFQVNSEWEQDRGPNPPKEEENEYEKYEELLIL
jgi:hypothetical protein